MVDGMATIAALADDLKQCLEQQRLGDIAELMQKNSQGRLNM
jgi:hypothetical protein